MRQRNAARADVQHIGKTFYGLVILAEMLSRDKINEQKRARPADQPAVKGGARIGVDDKFAPFGDVVKGLKEHCRTVADDHRRKRADDDDALERDGKAAFHGHAVGEKKRRHHAYKNKYIVERQP